MKNRLSQNVLFLIGIIIIFIVSLLSFRGPKPVELKDSENEFSAYHALEHLQVIANKPHSMGTQAQAEVREYIVKYMEIMGLETYVQEATAIDDSRNLRAGSVKNIIGVLRGTNNSKAIMIVAHYDSTPHTLGAADDGAGVSSMLETIRVVQSWGPLKNDVIFLFTDGEESGLFGARAFVKENAMANEVGLLLNLEARGSSGPAYTYEVSPDNGWVMKEYFKAMRYPIASSLAYEVYRLMPNSSDFTVFKEAGISGFNVAFLEDFVNYHSMNDSPENISLTSLQHIGSYAVDFVKHFGNIELKEVKSPDLLYFNFMGHQSVNFPQSMSSLLVIIATLLFFLVLVLGINKRQIGLTKISLGILVFIGGLAISLGAVYLLNKAVLAYYPVYGSYYSSNFYNSTFYLVAYLSVSLAVFSFVYALFYKKLGSMNLLFGILFINLLVMFVLFFKIPTAIYVSMVPLLLISVAILLSFLFNLSLKKYRVLFLIIHLLVLIPVIGFYMPMIKVLFVTFSLEFPIASVGLWLVLLGLLLVPLRVFIDIKRYLLSILALVIGIIALGFAHQDSKTSEDQPLQSSIFYALNHEDGNALWVSNVESPDHWNQQFFDKPDRSPLNEIYPYAGKMRLKSKAKAVTFDMPEVETYSDTIWDGGRIFSFRLKTAEGAENLQLYISAKAGLKFLAIDGHEVNNNLFYTEPFRDYYMLNYFGWPEEGIEFTLECMSTEPIEILVFEKKLGLPSKLEYTPMPASVIPQTGYESYLTLLRSRFMI